MTIWKINKLCTVLVGLVESRFGLARFSPNYTKMLLGLSVVVLADAAASRFASSVTKIKLPALLNLILTTGVLSWNWI
jgi:hypothetical protein